MAAQIFSNPSRVTTANGLPASGAKAYFYLTGTTTPQAVYADSGLVTPLSNPVIADSGGLLPSIYLDLSKTYRVYITTSTGTLIKDTDPLSYNTINLNTVLTRLDDSDGSSLIGHLQGGSGSTVTTVQTKLREVVSVKDFGAKGDGSTDDTAAFIAARDYFETASDYRGGTIHVPKGVYILSNEWAFTPYTSGEVFNIVIKGDGIEATTLDFGSCAAGKNGISAIGKGSNFYVENLSVKNAKVHGVCIKGGAKGTTDYFQRGGLKNVRIQYSGSSGFYTENSFMLSLEHVWSRNNAVCGFYFYGFHTSVDCRSCWATNNSDAGWRLNGMVYSSFTGCGSDFDLYGYRGTNLQAVKFTACGVEEAIRDGFFFETSTASTTGLPTDATDINIVMESCFATNCSTTGAMAFSNLLACLTSNSRPISVTTIGCVSREGTSTCDAITLNAASGAIDIWGYTTMGTNVDSGTSNTGGTIH